MSLVRQQVAPSAFEIRFSRTDAQGLEVFEIESDLGSQERIPDPFKKRDKIPRNSGSHMNSDQNFNNNNINNTAPSRHSSTDSTIVKKSKHYDNNLNNVSGQAKSKSSNAVGPEAEPLQRANVAGKNGNNNYDMGMTANSTLERKNLSEDESMIRNGQFNSKKRPFKVEENTGEKERDHLGKEISNHQTIELNGKIEKGIPNNKKTTQKNTFKNKKFNMPNNYKDEEKKLSPKDGIVTPPNTPPRTSPLTHSDIPNMPNISHTSNISYTSNTNTSNTSNTSNIPNIQPPHTLEESLTTPPLSSGGSATFNVDISTAHSTSPLKDSQITVGTNISNELQHPRGRRSSSSSRPAESLQESRTPNKSRESQKSQQSQPVIIKSRIPRLSMSSRERPVIDKKESHESLPSQGSNDPDELKESQSSKTLQPETSKLQPIRVPRSSKSRPIINTFISYAEIESESPTSPTTNSPTGSFDQPKKPIIPHDEVIVPTVAKKLKMNGQLHFANHDALLGYTEESEIISPTTPTTENGYMDVTDQVIDLFDNPQNKKHKRQPSVPDSQRRQKTSTRKDSYTGHSRNSSTHYIAPRKQNHQQPAQHVHEECSSPMSTQFEDSSDPSMVVEHSAPHDDDIKRNRKSRREEYIMVVRDDDEEEEEEEEEDVDITEPRSSMSLSPSEPSTAPTTEVESREEYLDNDNKVNEIINPVQMPVVQVEHNPYFEETTSVPVPVSAPTNGKKKKEKKNRRQKKDNGDLDEDMYTRKSKCCCIVQ